MDKAQYCCSGLHLWDDPEDRKRCCNPNYVRVQALSRRELEEEGAEHIVFRQLFRGWRKIS